MFVFLSPVNTIESCEMVTMGLLDGNIFEIMRLILPEHRMLTKKIEREQMLQTQPVLSEDQLAEMQHIIGEAIENGSQVRMTLFGTYENKTVVGHPVVENGRLKMRSVDGIEMIPMDKLLGVVFI
jgi:hypothetical protein